MRTVVSVPSTARSVLDERRSVAHRRGDGRLREKRAVCESDNRRRLVLRSDEVLQEPIAEPEDEDRTEEVEDEIPYGIGLAVENEHRL